MFCSSLSTLNVWRCLAQRVQKLHINIENMYEVAPKIMSLEQNKITNPLKS